MNVKTVGPKDKLIRVLGSTVEGTTDRKVALLEAVGLISNYEPSIADTLDVSIDLLLLLSQQLEEGHFGRPNNSELSFSEKLRDPLGNPLQIRSRAPTKIYFSPQISELCRDLCQAFSIFREGGNTNDFFEVLGDPLAEQTPKRLSRKISKLESRIEKMVEDCNELFKSNKELHESYNDLAVLANSRKNTIEKLRKRFYSKSKH